MFGPEYCFPIRLESDASPNASVVAAVVAAARERAGAIRIEAPRADLVTADAITATCRHVGADVMVALWAPQALVEAIIRHSDIAGVHIVTVSVADTDSIEALARVADAVFEREIVLEFALPTDSDPLADELERLGAWQILRPDDATYQLRGGDIAIAADGHVDQRAADGAVRRSANAVHEVGLDAALASLGLDASAFELAQGALHLAMVDRIPEPDGPGRLVYWGGGSQAFGHYLAQEQARAALGFHSTERDAYERWLEQVPGVDAESEAFPAFAWGYPDFGVVKYDSAHKLVSPPRKRQTHPALVFASWLAQGRLAELEYALGLRLELPSRDDGKRSVDELSDADRKRFASQASALLATAIQIVAMSRVPSQRRTAAVTVLLTLATPEARRAAEQLVVCVPEVVGSVHQKFRNRAVVDRRKRAKNPAVAMQHLREAVAQLAEIFGEQGGPNA